MFIELIDDVTQWNTFVDENPDRTLFHKWELLKVVEKHSGYIFLPYGIYDANKILTGIFPLFYQKQMGMRSLFSQPPRSGIPFTGLLLNPAYQVMKQRQKENCLNMVVSDIITEINKISPHYVSVSMSHAIQDIRPFLWEGFGFNLEYTYIIDVKHRSLNDIWDSFEKDCKREIRTAEAHKLLMVEASKPHDIEQFYAIVKDRYHQQHINVPLFNSDYLKDLVNTFPDNIKLYTLSKDNVVVGMDLNYIYNNRLILWMGAVNFDKSVHSNEYFTWEFIKQAKISGCDILELHGADVKRLSLFKSKFSPCLEHSFQVYKKNLIGKCAEWVYMNVVKRG